MSEVKRYDIYSDGFDNFSISEDEAGRYVSLEDYTALQQKLDGATKLADACKNAEMVWEKTMMEAISEDGPACVSKAIAALKSERDAVVAENAVLKSVFDTVTDLDNEPEFHYQGMGCGLEGRGIIDRYEAMKYGWDEAMERIYGEVIPSAEEVLFPATDAILNSVRAEGVSTFVKQYAGNLRTAGGGDGYHPEPYHDMADHIEAKCELYVDQLRADAAKGGSDD